MSNNIGKKKIKFNRSVELSYDGSCRVLKVSGSLGELSLEIPLIIYLDIKSDHIYVYLSKNSEEKMHVKKAMWGLYRTLIHQMILGVSQGYIVDLELVGVGYRCTQIDSKTISLKLGYSKEIIYDIPPEVRVECVTPTYMQIRGIDKQKVYQVASKIRSFRVPDSYKGKGVRYKDEMIKLKEGKRK